VTTTAPRPAGSSVARAGRVLLGLVALAGGLYLWRVRWYAEPSHELVSVWLVALVCWQVALYRPVRWQPGWSFVAATAIIAAAMVPRLLWLSTVPWEVAGDEVIPAYYGLEMIRESNPWDLLAGKAPEFFRRNLGAPFPTQLVQGWPAAFTAPLLGARLASAILAALSLVGTYCLAARLLGRGAALAALVVLGCSHWHIAYSRMAYTIMQVMAIVPWALHAIEVGVGERNYGRLSIGGALLALTLFLYTPARVVIPIAGVWLIHAVLFRRIEPRRIVPSFLAIGISAVLLLTPYLRSRSPMTVFTRVQEVTLGRDDPISEIRANGLFAPDTLAMLERQAEQAAAVYYRPGAIYGPHDYVKSALLDPFSVGAALLGLVLALFSPRDNRRFLLLVWVGMTWGLGQLLTDLPNAAYRASPLLPAVAIAAGLALRRLAELACKPVPEMRNRVAGGIVLLLLGMSIAPWNARALRTYFDAKRAKASEMTAIARVIESGPDDVDYRVVTGTPFATHFAMRYLAFDRVTHHVPALSDVLGAGFAGDRDSLFVISPSQAGAAAAIRSCYPSAEPLALPAELSSVSALRVPRAALENGRGCATKNRTRGLLARYFAGPDWSGPIVNERIEEWPVRFRNDPRRYQSIEWSGSVEVERPGRYDVFLSMHQAQGSADLGPVHLDAPGRRKEYLRQGAYPIRLRCRPQSSVGYCIVRWQSPGTALGYIPPAALRPPPAGDRVSD